MTSRTVLRPSHRCYALSITDVFLSGPLRRASSSKRCGCGLAQARLFAAAGVTKIRLTGGEPTIRKDIVQLTEALAALPGVRAVGLTTNGIALQRKLPALKNAGAHC